MSDGGLRVVDGTHLIAADLSLPENSTFTGAQIIHTADSTAAASLYGLKLPENFKSSALKRLDLEHYGFLGDRELEHGQALRLFRGYIDAIADQLRDNPILVSVLDGNTIRLFLEDEDDFAMLAENLFTDLDLEDEGKLSKSEIRTALFQMGVDMGVPSFSDLPLLNDILKKHGAEGEEKLGQAQFAQLLQPILQDLADALALKPITVIQNVKIVNGSKLRKLLDDENLINEVTEKIYQQKNNDLKVKNCAEMIRDYLEKNGEELGLPPLEANESVVLLYDAIFSDIYKEKKGIELQKNELGALLKQILHVFLEQLQANPVFHDALN